MDGYVHRVEIARLFQIAAWIRAWDCNVREGSCEGSLGGWNVGEQLDICRLGILEE
jgi:hypothetical protein